MGVAQVNGKDKVIKHLEMTQGVINRLGGNSFLLKSWSMTALVATMVLISRQDTPNPYLPLTLIVPIMGFWILDGYFLWQEKLFRKIYDEVRQQDDTDFKMDVMKHRDAPRSSWIAAVFSTTLIIFYLIEVVFIFLVFITVSC